METELSELDCISKQILPWSRIQNHGIRNPFINRNKKKSTRVKNFIRSKSSAKISNESTFARLQCAKVKENLIENSIENSLIDSLEITNDVSDRKSVV